MFAKNATLKVFSSIYEEFNRCKDMEVHQNSFLECDRTPTTENSTSIDTDSDSLHASKGKLVGYYQ